MSNDNPKIAVFDTSSIFTVCPENYPWAQDKKCQLPDGTKVLSLGKLEQALEEGYTCFVASTREKLGDHDQWWVELVGKDNVFLAGQRPDSPYWWADTNRNERVSMGWIKLFERLGIEYPHVDYSGVEVDEEEEPAEPPLEFWTSARHVLYEDHGIREGRSFKCKQEKQHDAHIAARRKDFKERLQKAQV